MAARGSVEVFARAVDSGRPGLWPGRPPSVRLSGPGLPRSAGRAPILHGGTPPMNQSEARVRKPREPKPPRPSKLVSHREMVQDLGISYETFRRLVGKGEIPRPHCWL